MLPGASWPAGGNNEPDSADSSLFLYRGTDTSYSFSSPKTDEGYYQYRVRACTEDVGCASYLGSNAVTVAVLRVGIPQSLSVADDPGAVGTDAENPSYINTDPSNDGRFTLQWDEVEGAQAYRLEESTDGGGSYTSTVLTLLSHTVGGQQPALSAGSYKYRVRACADLSCSDASNGEASRPVLDVNVYDLSPPALFVHNSGGELDTEIKGDEDYSLNWDPVSGDVSYEIREGTNPPLYTGSAESQTLEGIPTGSYSYSIRVCGSRGVCGAWSTSGSMSSVTVLRYNCNGSALASSLGFNGGDGTNTVSESPFLICNYVQLDLIRNNLSAYYKLGQNIEASGESWVPVGSSANCGPDDDTADTCFQGSLNGQGFSIENLSVSGNRQYAGLFGYIGANGRVFNVGLRGVQITPSSTSSVSGGALAGYSSGTIRDSYAQGSVRPVGRQNFIYAGGLVGHNEGSIQGAYAAVDVLSDIVEVNDLVVGSNKVSKISDGGLVGLNEGSIVNSYAAGSLTGTRNNVSLVNARLGGLVGRHEGDNERIENTYTLGSLPIDSSSSGLVGNNVGSEYDTQTIFGLNYAVSAPKGIVVGGSGCHYSAACVQRDLSQLRALESLSGWDADVWDFGDSGRPPMLKYSFACGEGTGVVCGDALSGQDFANLAGSWVAERWRYSWSECDAACGGGRQWQERDVNCPYDSCSGTRPDDRRERDCNTQPCCTPWTTTDYAPSSSCSLSCGGGALTETRSVSCSSPGNCCSSAPDSSRTVSCNTQDCDWTVGPFAWASCVGTCGSNPGTEAGTRSVTCTFSQGCGAFRPSETDTRDCTTGVCCSCSWSGWGAWTYGSWQYGTWSGTGGDGIGCGTRTKTREKTQSRTKSCNLGGTCQGDGEVETNSETETSSDTRSCNNNCKTWSTGTYGACSVTACGTNGSKSRSVTCAQYWSGAAASQPAGSTSCTGTYCSSGTCSGGSCVTPCGTCVSNYANSELTCGHISAAGTCSTSGNWCSASVSGTKCPSGQTCSGGSCVTPCGTCVSNYANSELTCGHISAAGTCSTSGNWCSASVSGTKCPSGQTCSGGSCVEEIVGPQPPTYTGTWSCTGSYEACSATCGNSGTKSRTASCSNGSCNPNTEPSCSAPCTGANDYSPLCSSTSKSQSSNSNNRCGAERTATRSTAPCGGCTSWSSWSSWTGGTSCGSGKTCSNGSCVSIPTCPPYTGSWSYSGSWGSCSWTGPPHSGGYTQSRSGTCSGGCCNPLYSSESRGCTPPHSHYGTCQCTSSTSDSSTAGTWRNGCDHRSGSCSTSGCTTHSHYGTCQCTSSTSDSSTAGTWKYSCSHRSGSCSTSGCTTYTGSWSCSSYGACSASCGGSGTQTRSARCSGGSCNPSTRPSCSPTSKNCRGAYTGSWSYSGSWGSCSWTGPPHSGGYTQSRSGTCSGGCCNPLYSSQSRGCTGGL